MKKILQINGKSKVRKARAVEVMGLKEYGALDIDSRVALIQELIPIGLMHVAEGLQRDVEGLAGKRYKRDGTGGYDRWGKVNQKQRWVATSLLSIEQRLNRVKGYRHLIELRNALQREIQNRGGIDERKEAAAA